MWLATTIAIAGLSQLTACGSASEPASNDLGPVPDVAFTTDATGYVAHRLPGGLARYRFRVISRYENRATFTVYLGRCFLTSPVPLFGVVSTTISIPAAYAQSWGCVGHNQQFVVPTGDVRVDTLDVEGPNIFDGKTSAPFGVTEGDFRLFYDVRLAAGDDAPVAPDSVKFSSAFRVRTSETPVP